MVLRSKERAAATVKSRVKKTEPAQEQRQRHVGHLGGDREPHGLAHEDERVQQEHVLQRRPAR